MIRIEDVWKQYRLGVFGHGALYRDVQSWWARVRGKPDPNSPVGFANYFDPNMDGDRVWALREVSMDVHRGETLGIVGRNGAGKSTLLKILSRVTAPTKGVVKIKGRIASLLEVGIGFHPELTGRENVYLNGAILGMKKAEIRSKFDEILDFAGVEQYVDTPVKRYSSGMHVRLAFAVAAHLEPEILVVDEVLAVGDAQFQRKCLGKMSEVSKAGRTVLFVSHNLDAVASLCSRAIWIQDGTISLSGETDGVVSRYLECTLDGKKEELSPSHNSGSFRLRKMQLFDSSKRPLKAVRSGESVILAFPYSVGGCSRPSSLTVNARFSNAKHNNLLNCVADLPLSDLSRMPGEGILTCAIPLLPLAPGLYDVAYGAKASGQVVTKDRGYLKVVENPSLNVHSDQSKYSNLRGSLVLDYRWTIQESLDL